MSRLIFLFFAVFFLIPKTHAQQSRRGNVWYFGYNAGIDFNSGIPQGTTDGKLSQWEGCASICDEKGKIVLYTNGIQIWNGSHQIISGDTPLGGNNTSTQSALIVAKPGNKNIYYVFTTNTQLTSVIVDLTLNKGRGAILSKTVIQNVSTEKLAGIRHCNNTDIWILSHEAGNNVFKAFLLTKNGLQTSSVDSKIGTSFQRGNSLGYMKFSTSGNRLAVAMWNKRLYELFNFDNKTGIVSDPISLIHEDFDRAYGVEFSPNGRFLYVSKTLNPPAPIYQMDISSLDPAKILDSKVSVGESSGEYFGGLQIGPDGKIYVAKNRSEYLSVIHKPNEKADECMFINNGFKLPSGTSGIGLPNIVASTFRADPTLTIAVEKKCKDIKLTARFNQSAAETVYQWFKNDYKIEGANKVTYRPESSGLYTFSVISKCEDEGLFSEPVEVKVLEADPEWSLVECGTVKLSVHADTKIKWSGKGITRSNEKQEEIVLNGFGKESYKVKVYDETAPDCYLEKKLDVDFGICDPTVLIPDIFTPNQDGINEKFEISIVGGESLQLIIYNRWGTRIYSSTAVKPAWDGNVQGERAPIGAYTFTLQYKNLKGQEFSLRGTLLLQR